MRQIPVALFVRVSKKEQDWQRQVADLQAVATARGWLVVATIQWKGSATKRRNAQRPEVQQLRALVERRQIEKVLITEVSRLARKPSQAHELLEELTATKVSIYMNRYAMETLLPNSKLNPAASIIFAVAADFARGETEDLSDRIKSGHEEARRQGKHIGRPAGTTKTQAQLLSKYPKVVKLLQKGLVVRDVAEAAGCSTNTVLKVKNALSS